MRGTDPKKSTWVYPNLFLEYNKNFLLKVIFLIYIIDIKKIFYFIYIYNIRKKREKFLKMNLYINIYI